MQGGPAARCGGWVGIGLLAEERQTQFHIAELQAQLVRCAAIDTGKSGELAATHREHVHTQGFAGGLARRRRQGDALGALLKGQVAFELHKAIDIDLQMARDLRQVALGAVHAELEAAGRAGRHRQVGLACRIVDHQGALRFGCNDSGGPSLGHREGRVEAARHVADLQVGHVQPEQMATKADFHRFGAEKFDRGAGTADAGDSGIQQGLDLGTAHVRADLCGGDGAAAVCQCQGVTNVAGAGVDGDALELTGGAFALGDVAGLDHGQAQVAKMAGDVGHVDLGQCALEGQQEGGLAARADAGVDGDRDIACADGGNTFKRGLNTCRQHRAVGAVADGCALDAVNRNLEAATGQLGVHIERRHLQLGHIGARQSAFKTNQIGGCAIGTDIDRAQTGQQIAATGCRTQRSLHRRGTGAQGDVGCGVSLAAMGQAQAEHTGGAGLAVHQNALHFCHRSRAVLHQRIIKRRAGEGDGLAGNVGLVERADKADHITLTAAQGRILRHADIGRAGLQQVGIGIFQVADVLCHVARHKGTAALLCGRSLAFNLQGHQLERLPGQRAACRHRQAVGSRLEHVELRAGNGKRGAQGRLNLRLRGIASDFGGGVRLAQIGQAELVTQRNRL